MIISLLFTSVALSSDLEKLFPVYGPPKESRLERAGSGYVYTNVAGKPILGDVYTRVFANNWHKAAFEARGERDRCLKQIADGATAAAARALEDLARNQANQELRNNLEVVTENLRTDKKTIDELTDREEELTEANNRQKKLINELTSELENVDWCIQDRDQVWVNQIYDEEGIYTCQCVNKKEEQKDGCLSNGGCEEESACPAQDKESTPKGRSAGRSAQAPF